MRVAKEHVAQLRVARERSVQPRAVCAGLLALALGGAATAETLKDGIVQARPGLWNWEQRTSILGVFNKEETNLECLIPEKASIRLSRLASDLDESCHVEDVVSVGTGYTFTLVCRGDISGKAKASLTSQGDSMAMRASGRARWGIVVAGLSMRADATYMGDCTPEQITREREKFLRKQAEEGK